MKKRNFLILLYLLIVAAGFFVVYRLFQRLAPDEGKTFMNYALFVGFALFTYINLKKLIGLIRNREK